MRMKFEIIEKFLRMNVWMHVFYATEKKEKRPNSASVIAQAMRPLQHILTRARRTSLHSRRNTIHHLLYYFVRSGFLISANAFITKERVSEIQQKMSYHLSNGTKQRNLRMVTLVPTHIFYMKHVYYECVADSVRHHDRITQWSHISFGRLSCSSSALPFAILFHWWLV